MKPQTMNAATATSYYHRSNEASRSHLDRIGIAEILRWAGRIHHVQGCGCAEIRAHHVTNDWMPGLTYSPFIEWASLRERAEILSRSGGQEVRQKRYSLDRRVLYLAASVQL